MKINVTLNLFFPMKFSFPSLTLLAVLLALSLPATKSQSQLALPPADPLTALQALQTANDDLLKRQDATLKELTEEQDGVRHLLS